MARGIKCTISDICIDYLVKNNFKLFIERAGSDSVNEWDWTAKRTDLYLFATDPVRLVALYMIREDWINERKQYKNKEKNQDYVSVFVGICESQELLDEYVNQDYEMINSNYVRTAFESDFHILYDEECLKAVRSSQMSADVKVIFDGTTLFDTDLVKQDYPDDLEKSYNVAITIKNMKYEGEREDILNDQFGYFKYLGSYPLITAEGIADAGNTCNYAVNKLVQWGYSISEADDMVEFSTYCSIYIAEKNGKKYVATDPLRLLGFVAMIQEYGEDWDYSNIVRSFSVQPVKDSFCSEGL